MGVKNQPPKARQVIRQTLRTLLDPLPPDSEIERMRQYFNWCCAYCGVQVSRGSGRAHKDHLIASENGGSNHIGNLILACDVCNNKKKKQCWVDFLKSKAVGEEFTERERHITAWRQQNQAAEILLPDDLVQQLEIETRTVLDCFNEAVERLRELHRARDAEAPLADASQPQGN